MKFGDVPPVVLAVFLTGLSQILVLEETLGVSAGHEELRATVESWIDRYEPAVRRRRSGDASSS